VSRKNHLLDKIVSFCPPALAIEIRMDQYVNARPDSVERAIDNLWIRSTQNFNSLDPGKPSQ
jgi:hypothetical protein